MSPAGREISGAILRLLAERGEADFPDETCGFIFSSGTLLHPVPMENIQNRLHREDPQAHPRDARTAYCFDPKSMMAVLEENERAGRVLWGIYHSHPDHEAYFSETDSAAAAPFGEPSYPGVVHIVLSVRDGKLADTKMFDWSDPDSRYVEIPLKVTG